MAAKIHGDYLIQANAVFFEKPAHWKPVITITRRPEGDEQVEPQTYRDFPLMFMNEKDAREFGIRFGVRLIDQQMNAGMSLTD